MGGALVDWAVLGAVCMYAFFEVKNAGSKPQSQAHLECWLRYARRKREVCAFDSPLSGGRRRLCVFV